MTGIAALDRATTNAPDSRLPGTGPTGPSWRTSRTGTYDVVVGLGDPSAVRDLVSVWGKGQQLAANVTTAAGQILEVRGRVTVPAAGGPFTLHLIDGGGKNSKFALNYLTLTADDPNATSLWPVDAKPAGTGGLSTRGAEFGVRFTADTAGYVSGIRFYKGTGNTGTHTGSLWAGDGTRLATATFTGETASGWQEVRFATPVLVQANTTYVASYYSPTGKYSVNLDYFAASGLTRGHLTVLPGPQGGGGVYARGDAFPTSTNRNSNYWVDVVYASETTPPTVTAVSPAGGATNVAVGAPVTVTFSEPMNPASVNANTVLLTTAGGTTVAASVTYDPAAQSAALTPAAALATGSTYTLS